MTKTERALQIMEKSYAAHVAERDADGIASVSVHERYRPILEPMERHIAYLRRELNQRNGKP